MKWPPSCKGLAGRIVPMACHVGKLEDLERLVDCDQRASSARSTSW